MEPDFRYTWPYELVNPMIESSPFTVNVSGIDLSSNQYSRAVDEIRNTPYTREKSYGFAPQTIDSDFISAHLVLTTPVVIQGYDEEAQEVEDLEVDRTELIPFQIDFEHQFLEVFSNQDSASKVVTRLGQITNWNISVSDSPLQLSKLFDQMQKHGPELDVTSLRISNFSLNEHTSGSCHLKVFEKSEVNRLFEKYGKDVTYIGGTFNIRDEEISVGFYRSGTIQFYSKSDEDGELLMSIKEVLNQIRGRD